jgi:hypothetical protein
MAVFYKSEPKLFVNMIHIADVLNNKDAVMNHLMHTSADRHKEKASSSNFSVNSAHQRGEVDAIFSNQLVRGTHTPRWGRHRRT